MPRINDIGIQSPDEKFGREAVNRKIVKKMVIMLDKVENKKRIVNWKAFENYCHDEMWRIPRCVIKECIRTARTKTEYVLASNL